MNLETFFNPASIAIVGVSREEKKVGHLVAQNMMQQGYKGELFFVNPKAETILGKTVFKSLSDIGQKIDLVILALPADIALNYLEELHQLDIHHIVLYAAGFKETDKEGKEKEELLWQKCQEYGITLLGPNCIGFINTAKNINATFLKHVCPAGNIGFISQSGALGSVLVDYFVKHRNLGFSYFISLGNKTLIDETDCLEFLAVDENTKVIAMYLEDVKNGKQFKRTLDKVSKIKPVIILKSGRTEEGSKAAVSHTGGLVGNDQVYSAAFKQYGAIQADDFSQLVVLLKLFSYQRVPKSCHILVLSNAGGAGVLLTDELITEKLSLVTITQQMKHKLLSNVGASKKITVHNPIDLLGDASSFDYQEAINDTLHGKEIGAIIVLLTPQANTQIIETAKVLIESQSEQSKPIFPIFMGGESVQEAHDLFEEARIASFTDFDTLTKTLSKITLYQDYITQSSEASFAFNTLSILANELPIQDIITSNEGKPFLNLIDSLQVLHLSDIPVLSMHHMLHQEELKHMIRKLGFPMVAKIASDFITHKTEVKGVVTDIKSEEELHEVFRKLNKLSDGNGCLVQKMVSGHEIFLGAKRDPHFGVVVVVGLGGIFTELLKDVSYRLYPFSYEEFVLMVKETKVAKLITGFRGLTPINMAQLYQIASNIGFLLERFQAIKEIDINPLFVTEKDITAADCRIILN